MGIMEGTAEGLKHGTNDHRVWGSVPVPSCVYVQTLGEL